MPERPITIERAIQVTQGLFKLLRLQDGALRLRFLQATPAEITQHFSILFPAITNNSQGLVKILDCYCNRFPRIASAANFAKFDAVLLAGAPQQQDGGEQGLSPVMKAIHDSQPNVPQDEHLEAFCQFMADMLQGARYLLNKLGEASAITARYRGIHKMAREVRSIRMQYGLFEDVSLTELKEKARVLLNETSKLNEDLVEFGLLTPESYLYDENGREYVTPLGFAPLTFAWDKLLQAADQKNALHSCQLYNSDELEDVPALVLLQEQTSEELKEIKLLKSSPGDYLKETAEKLCLKTANVESLSKSERTDLGCEIDKVLDEVWNLKLKSVLTLPDETISKLKEGRAMAKQLNEEEKTESKKKEKLEEQKAIQKIKDLGPIKQIPLVNIRGWLSWLSWYQSIVGDVDVSEIKKLSIILGSLKDQDDRKHCRNLPLNCVAKYLFEKYHKVTLIIQIYQQDMLRLQKPKDDNVMKENMRSVLASFDLLSHHNLLDKFDSGFIDSILLLVFTEKELDRFLRHKLDASEEAPDLSSTRVQADVDASTLLDKTTIDLDFQIETAEEKRTFFIKYMRKKLNALRHIEEQRILLRQRGGEQPLREKWGKKNGKEENIKKTAFHDKNHGKKFSNQKDRAPGRASFADGDKRNQGYRCLAGCSVTHHTKKGIPTKSLAYCAKFLKADEKEREAIVRKIPDFCRLCCNKKESHRGKQSCWYQKACYFCRKNDHSPLLCTNISAEEKKKIMNAHHEHKKKEESVKKVCMMDPSLQGTLRSEKTKSDSLPGVHQPLPVLLLPDVRPLPDAVESSPSSNPHQSPLSYPGSEKTEVEQLTTGCPHAPGDTTPPPSPPAHHSSPPSEVSASTEEVKKSTDSDKFVSPGKLDEESMEYGLRLYENSGNSVQGATGDVFTAKGEKLKAQFDIGATCTMIKDSSAAKLNLPILRKQRKVIKTLNGKSILELTIYRLILIDTKKNKRILKATGYQNVGGNPVISGELREKLATYFGLSIDELADPEGELDLLIGLDNSSVTVEIERKFDPPPANSPDLRVVSSPLVSGYMLMGTCGLDIDKVEEMKSTQDDLQKFIEAESQGNVVMNKCADCQRVRCGKCRYESSALSIQQEQELEEMLQNITIVKNPEEPSKNMFLVQYIFNEDMLATFPRHRNNSKQVLGSAKALRNKLEKWGRLTEYDDLIKTEVERGFMRPISEGDEIELAPFAEIHNRSNVVFRVSSVSTPARLTSDNSTLHGNGLSCNSSQVKGRSCLNLVHNVLLHFFLHPVPLLYDLAKAYRSVRTRTLTNSVRRFFWFDDPQNPETARSFLPLRMLYGDKEADKFLALIVRKFLAKECEEEEFGMAGKETSRILHKSMYLDDGLGSVPTKKQKDEIVNVIKTVFERYSLKTKHFISSEEFSDPDEFKQLETTNPDYTETVLGLRYNYKHDNYLPALTLNSHKKVRNLYSGPELGKMNLDEMIITKRVYSRCLMQQYDPQGLMISISIIRGKIIYSRICKHGCLWDEPLPEHLMEEARRYFKEIVRLKTELIPWPRPLLQTGASLRAIVALRDGSSNGLGAIVYFVSQLANGEKKSKIAAAKSRVSHLTMNSNEASSVPLSMNMIANMFAELTELHTCENIKVVSAGDSESVSFSYNPEKVEKNVLVRNCRNETIRAAQRILFFNPTAQIYLAWIDGKKNSSDLVSKEHNGLVEKINSSFFREGHPDYVQDDFGVKTQFLHINADGEKYTSLRQEEIILKTEEKEEPEAMPTKEVMKTEQQTFLYETMEKFEDIESFINCLVNLEKVKLKKSFKINEDPAKQGFSFNDNQLRRNMWKLTLKTSQACFPPYNVKQMLPHWQNGILVTRNRLTAERHLRYFGISDLPIISGKDEQLTRLLLNFSHIVKAPAFPGEDVVSYPGIIHLSQSLTKTRMKSEEFGVHVPNLRGIVRRFVSACVTCRKEKSEGGYSQEGKKFVLDRWTRRMGIFSIVSLDLIGPFFWTATKTNLRNQKKHKLFVLVLVDVLTSAVNFELLADYSSNAFILGLRTHSNRFTIPQIISCDRGSQLRAAARANEKEENEEITEKKTLNMIAEAKKSFKRTQFIIAPTESQHYDSSTEILNKQAKKMIRTFMGRIRKQNLPPTPFFQLQHLLTKVADLLNSRPIFHNSEFMLSANNLIKPYLGSKEIDLVKLNDDLEEKYDEFCEIFEENVRCGMITKAKNTSLKEDLLLENDFCMVKYPSRPGHFKYCRIISLLTNSTHQYNVRLIGKRNKDGGGKPSTQVVDIRNLVLLDRPKPDIVKSVMDILPNEVEIELHANEEDLDFSTEVKVGAPPPATELESDHSLGHQDQGLQKTESDANIPGSSTPAVIIPEVVLDLPEPVECFAACATGVAVEESAEAAGDKSERHVKKLNSKERRKERRKAGSGKTDQRRQARRAALRGGRKQLCTDLITIQHNFCEVAVTTVDMASLAPGKKVTDGIIDCYGAIVQKDYPNVLIIPTIVMQKMQHSVKFAVEGIPVDIFRYQRVIFPWHFPGQKFQIEGKIHYTAGHWIVITADLPRKRIFTFDSLADSESFNKDRACFLVREFLLHVSLKFHAQPVDLTAYKIIHKDCPKQEKDSMDCGVFAAFGIKAAASFEPPSLQKEEIQSARKTLAAIVHRGV